MSADCLPLRSATAYFKLYIQRKLSIYHKMNNNWTQRLLNDTDAPPEIPFFINEKINPAVPRQQIDEFLANSMAKLNPYQRESVLEELHGIRNNDNPESNPSTVDLWLKQMDAHLQNIKRGTVYEIAEAIDRKYVTDRAYRMMFLRASRYDPEVAALHVIKHLEVKRLLFGQEKLVKKIILADLNEKEKEFLLSGAVQVSKSRDRAGRVLLLIFPSLHRKEITLESLLRARYYVFMRMMESEENQKNGIIMVYFGAMPMQLKQHFSNPGLLWDLPIFYAGIHCCLNELSFCLLVNVAILRLPLNLRPRIRVHHGSCTECLYKLSSFGITREAVVTDANEPPLDDHFIWYRTREAMELPMLESDDDTLSVGSVGDKIVPRPADLLFGSGNRLHKGNLVMKSIILGISDKHAGSRRGVKVLLTERVIEEIKKKRGRFLKQNSATKEWEEASPIEVKEKVSHTFRNIRRPRRSKKHKA